MITRSKAKIIGAAQSDRSSISSSTTVKAQKLAAKAAHLRRLADLERSVAEAEHRAEIAALEAIDSDSQRCSRCTSHRSSYVENDIRKWIDNNLNRELEPPGGAEGFFPTSLSVTVPPRASSPIFVTSSLASSCNNLIRPSNLCTEACSKVSAHDCAASRAPLFAPQPASMDYAPFYQGMTEASMMAVVNTHAPFGAPQFTSTLESYQPRYERISAYQPVPQDRRPAQASHEAIYTAPPLMSAVTATTAAPHQQWPPIHTTLGTQHTQKCTTDNKILENIDSIHNLAKAVAKIAVEAKTPKVSAPLPIFDGHPTDWLVFKKMYDETSPSFSPAENLVRLNAALRGAARDCVVVLLAAARDPLEVIRSLETSFARPEQIILTEIAIARALPKLSSQESANELNTFACKVRNCVEIVRLSQRPEYLASPELCNEVVNKLTPLLRTRWADFATHAEASSPHRYRLELLSDFLMQEANSRTRYTVFTVPEVKGNVKTTKESCHVTVAASASPTCSYCDISGHLVTACKSFSALPLEKRWEWASSQKVCHKCFIKGAHRYRTCRKFSCRVDGCKGKFSHHTLLHKPVDTSANEPSVVPVLVGHNATSFSVASSGRPLLKVIAVTITGPKGSIDTFALLDDGSTATLIDSSVCSAVGAQGASGYMRVDGISGMSKESEVNFVSLEVKGRHSDKSYSLHNVRSISNLGLNRQSVFSEDLKSFDYLSDILQVLCYEDAIPMLLIGIENWHLMIPHSTRRGSISQPVASLTALGWVLYGSLKCKSKESYNCILVNHIESEAVENLNTSLDAQLQEYFRVDSIGISKKDYYSPNDQIAIQILEDTTKRLPSGKFETGLPWRPSISTMNVPNSFELARSRFLSLERKMKRDKQYAEDYSSNIKAMLTKNYADPCDTELKGGVVWYLPHFSVVHPQKRKLRVVHDASATCLGVSLNSLLLPGPDFLKPLLGVLMRFREGRIAMNGDIREMFPQTKIRPEDRDAQRFLWRDDPSKPLRQYRMSSMLFGAVSSPFMALYLKNKNAEEHRGSFPAAADAIVDDHYMDDYLGSVNSEEEARKLASDIVHIHAQAGLEMRSWVSNSKEALFLLPPTLCADASSVHVRVLGVSWNINKDTLCFTRNSFCKSPSKLTKRSVLSHLMRLYDPLGFLTPITIRGRILFQKTWSLCSDWDQELPSTFVAKWKVWFREGEALLSSSIPRHYLAHEQSHSGAQLHVFADASELAYACVAYWRFECTDGSVRLSLIGGKARLAPLKPQFIPRLELQAALIAARFATYITEAHRLYKPTKVTLWSDSLTVLKWLRGDARAFKPFVAHRVGEIAEITNVSDWRYVSTALNVADDATRTDKKFEISSRWFSGPSFLTTPDSDWPTEPLNKSPPVLEELKRPLAELVALTSTRELPAPVVPDATRFSKWLRLLRANARVLVCARIFQAALLDPNSNFPNSMSGCREVIAARHEEPTAEDIKRAEVHLLLHSQLASLRENYAQTERGEPPNKDSRIKNLTLFLDESTKLLRVSGRISAVEGVPALSQNPIVLDGKDRVVKLLIAYHHERAAHSNNELVVNELRQRFHIIGLRPAVKSVAASCLHCRIRKSIPQIPPTGDLPPERLAHHTKPFTCVGLDYFGPVSITVGRHTEKRYVALFTSLTVRAVHLEVIGNLSTDAAIMGLRRFIARRGTPMTLYSDNGTAFVGASRELSRFSNRTI